MNYKVSNTNYKVLTINYMIFDNIRTVSIMSVFKITRSLFVQKFYLYKHGS